MNSRTLATLALALGLAAGILASHTGHPTAAALAFIAAGAAGVVLLHSGVLLPLVLLVVACAPAARELDATPELGPDASAELEPEESTPPDSSLDRGAPVWLALAYPRCAGAWADRDDSSTRFVAHPDTGLCTFACTWLEPKCGEPWYGDPRCFPAHTVRLEQVCAELGGECLEASDGVRYCEAP